MSVTTPAAQHIVVTGASSGLGRALARELTQPRSRLLARGHGTIVNVASTGALGPNPGMVHYCAAKAGLAAASESLRGELRGTGVRVITVYPGPMQTPMLETAHQGYPKVARVTKLPAAEPAEVARRIGLAIERGSARVICPRVYSVFRYLPWLARWALDRFTPRPVARDRLHARGAPPPGAVAAP